MITIPTVKDVAKLAGVSASTVSIVLNGQSKERKIPDTTVSKVLSAIKELNYQPNIPARKLRSLDKNEFTIGIYWADDFRSNYLARFIKGIQSEVLKYNYPLNIVICPFKNNFLYKEKGIQNMNTFNLAIIAATSTKDMEYLNRNNPPIPIILFNRYSEKYHSVNLDNVNAGEKAARFLIKKEMKRFATISGTSKYIASTERINAFIKYCESHNTETIQIETEYSVKGGYEAADKILNLPVLPEAIFCSSDSIAIGLLNSLNKKGVKIPEALEVIALGLDNLETGEYSNPPLSIINIPIDNMASQCISMAIDILIGSKDDIHHVSFEAELIPRESCPQQ